jgi:hypothetical protein
MTVETLVLESFVRADEWVHGYRAPRAALYRRVGQTRRRLALTVARANPDYHGAQVEATLEDGAVDLRLIALPLPLFAELQQAEVLTTGTSTLPVGTRVSIVPLNDVQSGIPPRATFRDYVLEGVGTDLDGVAALLLRYTRLPAMVEAAITGATVVDLAPPFDDLLVLDLVKYQIDKAPSLTEPERAAAHASVDVEAGPLLADYLAHVRQLAPVEARFARPPAAPGGAA